MMGAVALVANYDKLNFDFIKRWFSYRTLARNDSGQAESFHFVGDSSNAFAVVDGDLLVCSPNTIRLYSGSGQAFVDQAVSMTNPVVSTAGGTALVYDAGGRELFVYSGREEVFSLTQEDGQALLSADVNQNGWLAVTSQESGHKGSVTVYDNSYSPLVRFSLSNRFVMDAAVAPDNKSVALSPSALRTVILRAGWTSIAWTARRRKRSRTGPARWATTRFWICAGPASAFGPWVSPGSILSPGTDALSGSYDYGGRYLRQPFPGRGRHRLPPAGEIPGGQYGGAAHHKRFR